MNSYEEKLERRRERYEELADKASRESEAAFKRSHDIVGCIPMGQPILVGHHSEKRHRADLKRSDNAMRKGCDESSKAEYYKGRALGVGKAGISSDDPEALVKLREKLEGMQANQEAMKKANAAWRKAGNKRGRNADGEYVEPPYTYELSNNNGNMKRVKERIKELEGSADRESSSVKYERDIEVVQNVDENRVQIIFDGKPGQEIRTILKRSGFRWSPYNMAWQRHLNSSGIYAAQEVIRQLEVKEI